MNYLYYIIPAVILFGVYFYFMSKKSKKMNLIEPAQPLTFRQKQILAHGAILAKYRGEDELSMVFDVRKKADYAEGLASQWDVSDHDSAVATITDLVALKKTQELDQLYEAEKDSQLDDVYNKIAKDLEIPIEDVKRVQSVYAWDTCRAISVAKWSCWLGYLTEGEAWKFMTEAAETAEKKGADWQEYTCSFLLGRALHGFGLDDIIFDCYKLLQGKGMSKGIYSEHPFK